MSQIFCIACREHGPISHAICIAEDVSKIIITFLTIQHLSYCSVERTCHYKKLREELGVAVLTFEQTASRATFLKFCPTVCAAEILSIHARKRPPGTPPLLADALFIMCLLCAHGEQKEDNSVTLTSRLLYVKDTM